MDQTLQIFMDYAAAFEETYVDNDWARLIPFFAEDATYEVRGGPLACKIAGREAIFSGLRKSIDGLDRRCTDRRLELTDGPSIVDTGEGAELSIGWNAVYQYQEAPTMTLPGRSVFAVTEGVIVEMRDEYDDEEMEIVANWMREYGKGLDGSYL